MKLWLKKKYQKATLQALVEDSLESGSHVNAPTIAAVLDGLRQKQYLINNDFQINHRGQSEYNTLATTSMYTLDMWRIYAGASSSTKIAKLDVGIRVESLGIESQFFQHINKTSESLVCIINVLAINGSVKFSTYDKNNGESVVWFDFDESLKVGINTFYIKRKDVERVGLRIYGNTSVDIEYIDLFEGEIAYQHVKEDYAIALLKCRRYILSDYVNAPILYSYNTNRYMFEICFPKMDKVPTLVTCNWSYWSSVGNPIAGTLNELEEIVAFIDNINAVTPSRADKQEKCYSIRIYYLISCEPL